MFSCHTSMNPRSAAALKVLQQVFANFQRAFWRIVSLWRPTCAKDSVVRWPAALVVWQEPRISRHSGWPSPHVFPPYLPGCAPFFRMQVASGVVLAFKVWLQTFYSTCFEQCFLGWSSLYIHYIKASRRLCGGFAEFGVAYAENSSPTGNCSFEHSEAAGHWRHLLRRGLGNMAFLNKHDKLSTLFHTNCLLQSLSWRIARRRRWYKTK